jgi:nucleoside-diphosphate-sugar epimerase
MNEQGLHVVFGSGPLGMATARALAADGKQVRVVNRSGSAAAPAGVEVVRGDAADPASVRAAMAGAAVVYQCAQPPYHRWPELFPALQAGIVAGAAAQGAKLVVAENLYMYGLADRPMTEDLPNAATTRKGRTRAAMSEALLAAHRRGELRVAIGRGSDFFGPGVVESLLGERVFGPAAAGKAAQAIGNPDLPHTYTFIDDFGRALATLGQHDRALGQIWHVPNPETLTTRQVITMIYEELGLPPKISTVSRTMLRLAGLFVPGARETVEMLYEFEHPFVVDSGKYVQAFGDHATPMRDAIRQTVAWYRRRVLV